MIKQAYPVILIICFIIVEACNHDAPKVKTKNINEEMLILAFIEDTVFTKDSAITNYQLETSGIYSFPVHENPDPMAKNIDSGKVMSFYYTLQVIDTGKDSLTLGVVDIYDENDGLPVRVRQGSNSIYPVGLDHGLALMSEGDEYGFILPSRLGFEDFQFSTLIPSNAVLLFTVRMITIENIEEIIAQEAIDINSYIFDTKLDSIYLWPNSDTLRRLSSGLVYKTLRKGGAGFPTEGDELTIHYTGRFLDSAQFDARSVADPFIYGFGSDKTISGFEEGLNRMAVGEKAILLMPSILGYNESGVVVPEFLTEAMIDLNIVPSYTLRVRPYQTLIFEVDLIAIN